MACGERANGSWETRNMCIALEFCSLFSSCTGRVSLESAGWNCVTSGVAVDTTAEARIIAHSFLYQVGLVRVVRLNDS